MIQHSRLVYCDMVDYCKHVILRKNSEKTTDLWAQVSGIKFKDKPVFNCCHHQSLMWIYGLHNYIDRLKLVRFQKLLWYITETNWAYHSRYSITGHFINSQQRPQCLVKNTQDADYQRIIQNHHNILLEWPIRWSKNPENLV